MRGRGDDAGNDVDQEQPVPGPGLGDPAADHRPDRRRQHGHDAGHRGGDRMQADRKQQEDGGEHRGDQRAAGKTLKHAEADQRRKTAAEGAADRGEGEEADRGDEQPPQGQHARQPARSAEWR